MIWPEKETRWSKIRKEALVLKKIWMKAGKKRYKMITNYQRGSGCARAQDGTELDGGRWSDPGPRLHIRALIYEYAKISVWYSIEIPWSILHQGLNLWVCKNFSLIFYWNSLEYFALIYECEKISVWCSIEFPWNILP